MTAGPNRVRYLPVVAAALLVGLAGCQRRGAAEPFGKTFYVGGASNIDILSSAVPDGLREAGYRGDVQTFIWTMSFNPLLDQLLTINAKARAGLLAQEIEGYRKRYPNNDINIIALSAGTGVAVWALEKLDGNVKVNNVVLLSSSLSHDYDVRRALRHVGGKIYTFHSPHDAVLAAVLVVGTIDGKRGVDSIGQVGLDVPAGVQDRIVNTAWSRKYMHYGWAGGHTDCINPRFIREIVGPLVVRRTPESTRTVSSDRTRQRASGASGSAGRS